MKLYQAILAGCQLSEQGFGGDGMTGKDRCALGAALRVLAPEIRKEPEGYNFISAMYPDVDLSQVWGRNDGAVGHARKWSREEIAYWLRDNVEGGAAEVTPAKELVCLPS